MKRVSLYDAFENFLEEPTAAKFLDVRQRVVRRRDYLPGWNVIAELSELAEADDFAELLTRVDNLMPTWALCPRVHYLAGLAAERLGEDEEVELRRFIVQSCLAGLVSTGQGTPDCPFVATYPSDERDALAALGLSARSRRLVEAAAGIMEVVTCTSQRVVWFDVTEPIRRGSWDPRRCPAAVRRLELGGLR